MPEETNSELIKVNGSDKIALKLEQKKKIVITDTWY
jgi:hypothetical protein